jgi:cytochrome c peroxidase
VEVKRFVVAACALELFIGASRHQAHLLPRFTSVIPPPPAPNSNPLTTAKIERGRRLFYDQRLSANGTQSCGSCHQQRFAFCDGRAHAIGSTGQEHFFNTMSLVNVAYRTPLTWSNRSVTTLEQQALIPLTNEHPVEMGMANRLDELPARLADYAPMFETAFPGETISVKNIVRAIASFERSIVSADSPYDRLVHRGDTHALSPEAWHGLNCSMHAAADVTAEMISRPDRPRQSFASRRCAMSRSPRLPARRQRRDINRCDRHLRGRPSRARREGIRREP